jgi:hypothetical protein
VESIGQQHTEGARSGGGPSAADHPKVKASDLMRPAAFALLGGIGLIGFYLGVITLAQDWFHALQQLAEDAWFIGAIVVGFSVQIGLFTYLRKLQAKMAVGGVMASTGTSTTAMLACCAHHLAEILPIIGLSGAAIFLESYKTPLLWVAIAMNAFGVIFLLRQVRRQSQMACHTELATT